MRVCGLCGKNGEELSLLSVNHKDLGEIMICRECWIKAFEDNRMVSGLSICSSTSCTSCRTCSSCG